MIEVLVALVVLSLGLLGMAGLQAAGLRTSMGAHYRAQAALYASDMADRMRANLTNAPNYALSMGATAASCAGLCATDTNDWLARLRTLPNGQGSIEINADRTVRITVRWDDSRAGGGAAATHVLVSRLWS